MRLHKQAHPVLLKPSATIAVAQLDKIHGAIVFIGPVVVFDAPNADIHENYTTRAQQGHHAAVRRADVSITLSGTAIGEHTLETAPLLDHAREDLGSLGIESRIESQGSLERYGRRRKMRVRRLKSATVRETVLNRNIVPAEDLKRIQVIDDRERVKLMQTRGNSTIFNIRQAADMKHQLRPAAACCQLKARALDIAIC